ncbi:MAG TPA: MBL fold metallo-hydrolase [Pseudonocardiaceae bacterium]|nr:MBL fold metallo-hydrolase [Pseudonocardiaceae bacterium]
MASIEFWGGLDVIGSSKIVVSDGGHRVLLDIGLDIPSGANLFRQPVRERPAHLLADRLRVGGAPRIPGLFDPAALAPGDPLADPVPGATHVFVSHPHIDHVGLAGFVRPDVPVHAHTDAVDLLTALDAAGAGLPGGDPDWQRMAAGDVVDVGPMRVECVPVDHDVPGATGYLVHTGDGTLAYTGDIRFHGRHAERSWAFADRAAGCAVLVTEATTLSFPSSAVPRTEGEVLASFVDGLAANGLVLLSMYPRDVERAAEFTDAARAAGRTIVWPAPDAAMLRALGVPAVTWGTEDPLAGSSIDTEDPLAGSSIDTEDPLAGSSIDTEDPLAGSSIDTVTLADVHGKPEAFVVQPDPADLPALLDLPTADVFLHANGEPLGEFDPRWGVFTDWLAHLGIPLERIGGWGHATPEHLHEFVERVAPGVVFPVHTFEPTRLFPPGAVRRVVPRYGVTYGFDGSVRG